MRPDLHPIRVCTANDGRSRHGRSGRVPRVHVTSPAPSCPEITAASSLSPSLLPSPVRLYCFSAGVFRVWVGTRRSKPSAPGPAGMTAAARPLRGTLSGANVSQRGVRGSQRSTTRSATEPVKMVGEGRENLVCRRQTTRTQYTLQGRGRETGSERALESFLMAELGPVHSGSNSQH